MTGSRLLLVLEGSTRLTCSFPALLPVCVHVCFPVRFRSLVFVLVCQHIQWVTHIRLRIRVGVRTETNQINEPNP